MHGPRPIPRGEHTTKTFDDDLIAPHCLNKTVTQRKWLPQIKCYPKLGRQSRGRRHQQDGKTGIAGDDPRPLPSFIQEGEKPDPRRVHRSDQPPSQAWHQAAGAVRRRLGAVVAECGRHPNCNGGCFKPVRGLATLSFGEPVNVLLVRVRFGSLPWPWLGPHGLRRL